MKKQDPKTRHGKKHKQKPDYRILPANRDKTNKTPKNNSRQANAQKFWK